MDGGDQQANQSAALVIGAPSAAPPKKKQRKMYDKWTTDTNMFARLKAAVLNRSAGNNKRNDGILLLEQIPRTTIQRHIATFEAAAKQHSIPLSDVTCEMIIANRGGASALLTADDSKFLSDIAISKDLWNNGMTRSEMITMVMELSQCVLQQQAKNHYDYLVRNGKLSGLKRGGQVIVAQKTTTKRSQTTIEQQLRWHTSVDCALAEQHRLNLPAEKFDKMKEHFFCNMVESSLLASDGTVKVIGSASKSKTEKIMEDCRASNTVLRTGAAGGSSGPWIFLAAGKQITCRALRSIDGRPGVPQNSKVYMMPSAYTTDSVYAEIAPQLADGVRRMPHICDHPDW
jgi:hypothetical protein